MKKLIIVVLVVVIAGFGIYKLYDEVSGSRAAREAITNLKKTADTWENTNVKTDFEP